MSVDIKKQQKVGDINRDDCNLSWSDAYASWYDIGDNNIKEDKKIELESFISVKKEVSQLTSEIVSIRNELKELINLNKELKNEIVLLRNVNKE